jgi:hypothetical protein
MLKTYKIERFLDDECLLYLPSSVPLNADSLHQVSLGSKYVAASCNSHPNGRNVIGISSKLCEELHFPSKLETISFIINDNRVYLGPLIGIFTAGFTSFRLNPIGERSSFFSKLLSVQSTLGVIPFVFGEKHIDWENGLIKGLFYFKNSWETVTVPFPSVIYDRLPNRRSEKKKTYNEIKEKLQTQYGIPWYNPGFFNKMDLFERLEFDEKVNRYLPETNSFQSFEEIERMLASYGHVFLKPKNGSLGNGIHKITYNPSLGEYYCRFTDRDEKKRLWKFSTLEQLINKVFRKKQLEKMLVQQGIPLLHKDHRPIDFRVHTNKDENGNWQVSALAAKVSGVGSVTTHVKSGGEVKSLNELFALEESKIYEERLKSAALTLSSAIDQNIDGFIGEIGFDLGIDQNEKVWMFEANSKPGRSIFAHPQLKQSDLLTRKLALSFGVYLSQKALLHPGEMVK